MASDNALFRRELRARGPGDHVAGSLFLLALLAISVALVDSGRGHWLSAAMVLGTASDLILLLLGPGLTADAFTQEREAGRAEMLEIAPLSRRAILWGVLLGRIGRLAPYLAGALLSMAVTPILVWLRFGLRVGDLEDRALLLAVLWFTSCVLGPLSALFFGASLGLTCSSLCRSTTAAIATAYGLLLLTSACLTIGRLSLLEDPGTALFAGLAEFAARAAMTAACLSMTLRALRGGRALGTTERR